MNSSNKTKDELIQEIESLREEIASLKARKKRTTKKKRTNTIEEVKQRFIETVAHELRTPVTPIRSVVDMFLKGMLGEITDQQKTYLEMIKRNIDRLVHFISEVTTLANLESNETTLKPERISVLATVHEAIGLLKKKAEMKNMTISLGTQTELFVNADPHALETIVTNLVDNAIMHNPHGTHISIETQLAGINLVRVTVCDNGNGIPGRKLEKIFESFSQPAREIEPGHQGAGMGLRICRKLVEKMGGEIAVDSKEGEGTIFTFTLPVGRSTKRLNSL